MLPISSRIVKDKILPKGSRLIGSIQIYYIKKENKMAQINRNVGKKIKSYRIKKKWTQEQLAFESNLHRAYIGQIERGEKNVGLKNLEKIAKTLSIPIAKLF